MLRFILVLLSYSFRVEMKTGVFPPGFRRDDPTLCTGFYLRFFLLHFGFTVFRKVHSHMYIFFFSPFLTFPCLHFIHPASFIPSLFSAPSLSLLFHFSFSRLFGHIPIFYRLSYTDTQKVYTSIFLVIFLSIYTQPETESHELLSFQHYHKSSCVPGRNGS